MTCAFSDKRRMGFEILPGDLKKIMVQAWGIAQWAMFLPHKHKELSWISSDHMQNLRDHNAIC